MVERKQIILAPHIRIVTALSLIAGSALPDRIIPGWKINQALSAAVPVELASALEIDLEAQTSFKPNDPYYSEQWYLEESTGWIRLWQYLKKHPLLITQEIKVAFLDSGMNNDHPDLNGILWENSFEIPGNNVDDDGNSYVDDVNGCSFEPGSDGCEDILDTSNTQHGTGTIGVFAANTDNGYGVTGEGAMFSPKIMVVKVMQENGTVNYSDVAEGLRYAQVNGANIIVMNFAGWPSVPLPIQDELIKELAEAGVILVAGSGNSADIEEGIGWPARNPYVIAVGASGRNGQRRPSSSFGEGLDLLAPGEDIWTTCYNGEPFFDFCRQGGTSFSAPQVAVAAVLAMIYRPEITSSEFRELLKDAAGETWKPERGYGPLRFDRLAQLLGLPINNQFLPLVLK